MVIGNVQWVQQLLYFWVALPLIAKNLSGNPIPTTALKIEQHSFNTPFKGVRGLFSTPITKFLNTKLWSANNFLIRLNQNFPTSVAMIKFTGNCYQIIYCIQLFMTSFLHWYASNVVSDSFQQFSFKIPGVALFYINLQNFECHSCSHSVMSGTPSALLNLGVPLRSAAPLSATLEPVVF